LCKSYYQKLVAQQIPDTPEMPALSRVQVLVAMGLTAVVFLAIAKLWLHWGPVTIVPVKVSPVAVLQGTGLGGIIIGFSSLAYRFWGDYRQSADFYLNLVLKPLFVPDLIWLGLLPGLSEELLFRGVMLPAIGLNPIGIVLSSLCFGVLHLSTRKQWAYAVWATVIGLLLGISAVWTGNLLVPIVAHVLANLISGVMWKWRDRPVTS
jgi:uncharacterized protein